MGQRDLLPSKTMDQDFPGKVIYCRQVFCFSIAQWSIEEDYVVIGKVAKGKGKTRGKNGKTEKCAEEQESTDNFENYDSRRLLMLLYQGLQKERKPRLRSVNHAMS